MSPKPLLLHYLVNAGLMKLGLPPVTPSSRVKFIRSNSYSFSYSPQKDLSITHVVIANSRIEIHEYSPDPREGHIGSHHASVKDFLSSFIGKRMEIAVMYTERSPEYKFLSNRYKTEKKYEDLYKSALILHQELEALRKEYRERLDKYLNSFFVKAFSLLFQM